MKVSSSSKNKSSISKANNSSIQNHPHTTRLPVIPIITQLDYLTTKKRARQISRSLGYLRKRRQINLKIQPKMASLKTIWFLITVMK
jgi:hypothetical protein